MNVEEMQALIGQSKFHQLFKPCVIKLDYEQLLLVVDVEMSDLLERQPATQQWHGGAILAIIDTVACYNLLMVTGVLMPTIDFRIDYLRPAIKTDLRVLARVRKAGKSIAVVDVDIEDNGQRLIAVGRGCFSAIANKHYS